MTAANVRNNNAFDLYGEVVRLRAELEVVRHQNVAILRLLSALCAQAKDIDAHEGNIEHKIADIAKEMDQMLGSHTAPTSCPTCGAPLHHHPAPSGDLCICPACGWSQFIDQRGHPATPAVAGAAALAVGESPPTSWVEH
jgi:hypothetical protein